MENAHDATQHRFPVLRLFTTCLAVMFWCFAFVPEPWLLKALTRSSGASATQIAPAIPAIFMCVACIFTVWAAIAWLAGRRIESSFFTWLTGSLAQVQHLKTASARDSEADRETRTSPWGWLLLCVVAVLWFDWPAIRDGFFESDDFYFLIEDRMFSWQQLLFAYTNDHLFPLVRLQIRLMHQLFGANAVAFNLTAIGSLIALLFAGILLLRELKVTRFAMLFFLFVCVNWTLWGEFTSGEYILLGYEQLMTWSLLIAWGVLRWKRLGQSRYLALLFLGSAIVSFANMSGLWVVCAGLVFLHVDLLVNPHAERFWRSVRSNFTPVLMLLIPATLALAFYIYAYTRPDSAGFLSVARERHGLSNLMLQWFYTMTTAILSVVVAVPHHLGDFRLLMPSMITASVIILGLIACTWKQMSVGMRRGIVGSFLVMSGVSLMICLGRPGHGYGHVVPPKYLFLPYVWLCILLACVVDGLFLSVSSRWHLTLSKSLIVFASIAGLCHGVASLGGGRGVPFLATTRGGELKEHRDEYAALKDIRSKLFVPLEANADSAPKVLELPGTILCQRYPILRYSWGQEPWMSHFIDVLAKDPNGAATVWVHTEFGFPLPIVAPDPLNRVDQAFLDLLKTSRDLQQLYFDPVEIHLRASVSGQHGSERISDLKESQFSGVTALKQLEGNQWEFDSLGKAELLLASDAMNVEHESVLDLHCEVQSHEPIGEATYLGLGFESAVTLATVEHRLVPVEQSNVFKGAVDLRQLPGYVLHGKAVPVRIRFAVPGKYRLIQCRRLDAARS